MEVTIVLFFVFSGFFTVIWLNERPHYPTLWEMAKAFIIWFSINALLVSVFL